MGQDDELERLKRLRDQQLAARDPRQRDRKLYARLSQQSKKKPLTLQSVLADFQSKWTWMFGGGLIGLAAAIFLPLILPYSWVWMIQGTLIFAGIALGRLMGTVLDWRSDGWGR